MMSDVHFRPLFDSNGKDFAVEHVQDIEPILDWAKEARTMEQPSDWGRHTHRIPNVELVKLLDEECARGNTLLRMYSKEWDEVFERKLKSGDWDAFRVDKPALLMGWMGFGS